MVPEDNELLSGKALQLKKANQGKDVAIAVSVLYVQRSRE